MLGIKKRGACPMRHENGNCLPAGGFCTAVNDCICEALHNAFNSGVAAFANELIRQSKEAPAEDVENVVRCKDCKRWTPDGGYGLDLNGKKQLYGICDITKFGFKENHFCSFGKKKEG